MRVSKLFHDEVIRLYNNEMIREIFISEDESITNFDRYRAAEKACIWQRLIEDEQAYRLTFTREEITTKVKVPDGTS